MTTSQAELAERFRALHEGPGFVMPNAWDGLSVRIFGHAGFQATATSSAAYAFALGRVDGRHQVTREEHLAHARFLTEVGELPVNGDFEDGYGETPADVAATVELAIQAGLAGIGIEDTSGDPDNPIRDFDDAVARVKSAAAAAKGRIVVTGRTDNFIQGRPDLDDTIRRLTAFAEAGADVLYAPYPPDMAAIEKIIAAVSPKPVNVLIGPAEGGVDLQRLFDAGVKRISLGSTPYLLALNAMVELSQTINGGDVAAAQSGLPFREALKFITEPLPES